MLTKLLIASSLASMSFFVSSIAIAQDITQEQSNPVPIAPQSGNLTSGENDDDGQEEVQKIRLDCYTIDQCNALISFCAEHNGHWNETGLPGSQGEPQRGNCIY